VENNILVHTEKMLGTTELQLMNKLNSCHRKHRITDTINVTIINETGTVLLPMTLLTTCSHVQDSCIDWLVKAA